jgi:LuxR family maltose regulon positive regulatory protein
MLKKSLRLAQPGGFIRVFADLGPQMSRMLSQLQADRELQTYVDQIQTAFPRFQETVAAKRQDQLAKPLTNRELQILELLRRRMTNKEIAAKLTISVGTVKGHTVHIYEKLGIKGRRQAVEKAIEVGILVSQ